jgi:host factor-I protein
LDVRRQQRADSASDDSKGPVLEHARTVVRQIQVIRGEIGMDANKPAAQNIQDSFLNSARKEKQSITIYLISGVKLTGRIRSFDKYSVVLETANQEQLIFKHAISTVVMGRSAHSSHGEPRPAAAAPAPVQSAEASASGTEG